MLGKSENFSKVNAEFTSYSGNVTANCTTKMSDRTAIRYSSWSFPLPAPLSAALAACLFLTDLPVVDVFEAVGAGIEGGGFEAKERVAGEVQKAWLVEGDGRGVGAPGL